jgi:hypothetical protein
VCIQEVQAAWFEGRYGLQTNRAVSEKRRWLISGGVIIV